MANHTIERVMNKIKSIIRLGATESSVSERNALPSQKVSYLGKTPDSVPFFPYGMHARPKRNWLSLVLSYGGISSNRWHMVTSAERRPTDLKDGEIAFYHPPTMSEIRFKSDGTIEATTSLFKVNGDIAATGEVTANADGTAVTLTGHKHAISGGSSSPGPTDIGLG